MIFTAFILSAILVSLLSGAIWCLGYALGWWPRKLRSYSFGHIFSGRAKLVAHQIEDEHSNWEHYHHITCNHPHAPIGYPGCICKVVNKHEWERLDRENAEATRLRDFARAHPERPRKLRVLRPDWRYGHPEFFRPLDTWPRE
jgi:hypothetical protein